MAGLEIGGSGPADPGSAGVEATARDDAPHDAHDAPCRCLGSCITGAAPPLPLASARPDDLEVGPTLRALATPSVDRPLPAVPAFLRPWVRGPPAQTV